MLIDTRNLFHLKSLDKGQHSEFTFEKENAKKSLLERIHAMKHAAMPSRSWSVFSWSIVSTPSSQQKLVGGIRLATAGFPSPSKRLIPFWRFGSESVQWPYNAYYPRYRKFSFSGPQWLSRFSVDLGIKFWLRQRRVLCDYCLKIWTVVFLFRGLLKTHISIHFSERQDCFRR